MTWDVWHSQLNCQRRKSQCSCIDEFHYQTRHHDEIQHGSRRNAWLKAFAAARWSGKAGFDRSVQTESDCGATGTRDGNGGGVIRAITAVKWMTTTTSARQTDHPYADGRESNWSTVRRAVCVRPDCTFVHQSLHGSSRLSEGSSVYRTVDVSNGVSACFFRHYTLCFYS